MRNVHLNMSDKEHEIPVKVVDRRWWANQDADAPREDTRGVGQTDLCRGARAAAGREGQTDPGVPAKYRQAAAEFEEARLRLRREISKDVERSRREILSDLLEVVDNLDRAMDRRAAARPEALVQGVEMVRRQFLAKLEGFGVKRIDVENQPLRPHAPRGDQQRPGRLPRPGRPHRRHRPPGYRIGDEVLRPAAVAVAKTEDYEQLWIIS